MIQFIDLGKISYESAYEKQEAYFNKVLQRKNEAGHPAENYVLFCEHPHVYTLGKSGDENNLLVNQLQLRNIEAEFHKTNRGGDITYHGPGQIVAYPIFNLEDFNLGVKQYVFSLEQVIIKTLELYKIKGFRLEKATGVWVNNLENQPEKVCAIGIRTSRYITMHGFAFNITTDLNYFDYINPCGFTDKKATSLSKILNKNIDIDEIKRHLKTFFLAIFENNK